MASYSFLINLTAKNDTRALGEKIKKTRQGSISEQSRSNLNGTDH